MQKKGSIVFFIGTEAELIKVFPIMLDLQERNVPFYIIASGQNDITKSTILQNAVKQKVTLELAYEKDIKKSAVGLFSWFFKTYRGAAKKIEQALPQVDLSRSVMIVHGDTVSTLMGAYIGKKLKMKVAHVEAGLRSHNLLNPFPEEIDRILTSRKADIHFAPGEIYCENLKKKKNVVNTYYNTIVDSLQYSYTVPSHHPILEEMKDTPYFVFVIHRQENLAKPEFVNKTVQQVITAATKTHCVFVLHKITENTLQSMGLLESLSKNENITFVKRMEYFDFMKLLTGSQFVVTDGGSNQEELHYMGKPCLIMRKKTERNDGIGQNAILYKGNIDLITQFASNYEEYKIPPVTIERSPSKIITETVCSITETTP